MPTFAEELEAALQLIEKQFEQKISAPEKILLALCESYLKSNVSVSPNSISLLPHYSVIKSVLDLLSNATQPQNKDAKSIGVAPPIDRVVAAIYSINRSMENQTDSKLAAILSAFLFYFPQYARYFTPNILNNLQRDSGLEALMRIARPQKLFKLSENHDRQLFLFAPWINPTLKNKWLNFHWNKIITAKQWHVYEKEHASQFGALLASAEEKWQTQALDHMEQNEIDRNRWLDSSEQWGVSVCSIFRKKPELKQKYPKIISALHAQVDTKYKYHQHALSAYLETFPEQKESVHACIKATALRYFEERYQNRVNVYMDKEVVNNMRKFNIPLTPEMKDALNKEPKHLTTVAQYLSHEPDVGNFSKEEEQKIFQEHLTESLQSSILNTPFFIFFFRRCKTPINKFAKIWFEELDTTKPKKTLKTKSNEDILPFRRSLKALAVIATCSKGDAKLKITILQRILPLAMAATDDLIRAEALAYLPSVIRAIAPKNHDFEEKDHKDFCAAMSALTAALKSTEQSSNSANTLKVLAKITSLGVPVSAEVVNLLFVEYSRANSSQKNYDIQLALLYVGLHYPQNKIPCPRFYFIYQIMQVVPPSISGIINLLQQFLEKSFAPSTGYLCHVKDEVHRFFARQNGFVTELQTIVDGYVGDEVPAIWNTTPYRP